MRNRLFYFSLFISTAVAGLSMANSNLKPNWGYRDTLEPEFQKAFVDFAAFDSLVTEVQQHRAQRMVPLNEWLYMSQEDNTVILDTRSKNMYNNKHVKGAIHLNFSDFTYRNLRRLIPNQDTRILIYCNNNFRDDQYYFATKSVPMDAWNYHQKPLTLALNIPTYINLYGYGYENVFELSDLVSIHDKRIEFEGTNADAIGYGENNEIDINEFD